MHLPFILGHHMVKHATLAHLSHVAHQSGAGSAGHVAGHAAAGHVATAGGVTAAKGVVATKVGAHTAVAKSIASGAAAKSATVHAAHGTVTPVGHAAVASSPKAVIPVKHVAKKAVLQVKPFRPVVPPTPPVA